LAELLASKDEGVLANYLKIVVTDPDPDYLGIEVFASGDRFSGATKIYAGLDELTEFAKTIRGFPASREDERTYVFGTKAKGAAGGYCKFRFYCRDGTGRSVVDIEIEDDDGHYSEAAARFTFTVLPAENRRIH
jgi:hypothetical protein